MIKYQLRARRLLLKMFWEAYAWLWTVKRKMRMRIGKTKEVWDQKRVRVSHSDNLPRVDAHDEAKRLDLTKHFILHRSISEKYSSD
jgi:hypothetical protein